MATKAERERLRWERRAEPVFRRVYNGQMRRIANAIQRADENTIQMFIAEQWQKEPALVKQAILPFYDQIARMTGESAITGTELLANWEAINEALFTLASDRAEFFANAMTQTSIRQSQVVIRDWLTTGGDVGQLMSRMRGVWTGPRPDAAAVTETTFMVAESKITAWEQTDAWGFNVNTMEDSVVRPSHTDVSNEGPYPMSDTEHRPPVFGDVNCRCFVTPVRENPNAP